MQIFRTFRLAVAFCAAVPLLAQAGRPLAGDFAARGATISQFEPTGAVVRTVDLSDPDSEARGIAFGPGGLYVVRSPFSGDSSVELYDRTGALVKRFAFDGRTGGLATSGNLRFAPTKDFFYVSTQDGIYRFPTRGTRGTKFIDQGTTDVAVMPNSELLVADDYSISRFSADGRKLQSISGIADPHRIGPGRISLTDVRGVAYDASTDTTFVTMLGYSDFYFQLLALEGTTNVLKGLTSFWYGAVMDLTADGHLLVGSGTQSPGLFTFTDTVPMAFTQTGSLETPDAVFVTSKPPRGGR